jgi:hypothetical protein
MIIQPPREKVPVEETGLVMILAGGTEQGRHFAEDADLTGRHMVVQHGEGAEREAQVFRVAIRNERGGRDGRVALGAVALLPTDFAWKWIIYKYYHQLRDKWKRKGD